MNQLLLYYTSPINPEIIFFSIGGSFVLKVFTLFEPATISLLYLLRISFGELHAFKPCTSKEGNSEIYLIATHYRKTEENLLILNLFKVHVYDEYETIF